MANKKKKFNPEKANRKLLGRTMIIMVLCGVLLFVPVLFQLFGMMVLDHEEYESGAINNQTRSTSIEARRGLIYDRNMDILATSTTVETVFIDPNGIASHEEDVDFIATGLAQILGVKKSFILEQAADTDYYYKIIARKQPQEVADQVRAFIADNELVGIYLEPEQQRYYPRKTLAAQVIGFLNSDNVGVEGLEFYYNDELTGTAGKTITTKGNYSTEMLYSYEKYYEASDGCSLVLTLDTTVQEYMEKNLEAAVEKYKVQNGAFSIMMDVNTGEILGMATLGSYDPNHYLEIIDETTLEKLGAIRSEMNSVKEGTEEYQELVDSYNKTEAEARLRQWRNRCVADGYEPGSTFKTITLAAALEEGTVSLGSQFYCGGQEDIVGRDETLHCWKHEGHGAETTAQALQNSCNLAFAHIGIGLGAKIYDYADAFGLMEYTGIDMSGEAVGYFYNRSILAENAFSSTASFGQSFKVTPIQLVRAIAAVVNGGYVLKPYVVSEVLDDNGNVISRNGKTVLRQAISEQTSETMRDLMESVVTEGTAGNAALAGYRIGGKTGTSEKLDVLDEFGRQTEDKIVSFVGVAPIDDPKYIVLVALDTPSPYLGYYISGGVMAAPVVRDIFADTLQYLGVQPDYTNVDMSTVNVEMPNLKGMDEAQAAEVLAAQSLTYKIVGVGSKVTGQIPAALALLPGNSEVILYMGEDVPTDTIVVPNLSGLTPWECNLVIQNTGLYLQTRGSSQIWATVTGQDIPAGTEVPRGTMITVELTDSTALD